MLQRFLRPLLAAAALAGAFVPGPQAPVSPMARRQGHELVRRHAGGTKAEDINNSSIIPKIDACLRRSENRYEAVVTLARKAKQRALLDQMGDGNLDGVKPLIAQMDEELEQWEADPAYGEMRDQSWPAKIGVVFVDEDNVDTKVAAEAQKFPGEG